jgi:ParB/RepB/Spo0J family partition protein
MKTLTRVSSETMTETIDADKLHDHPINPPSRIQSAHVDELVKSIDEFGQRDPVRVRTINDPIGHYQILSGHRRVEACRRLDRPVICLVVDADDDEALREVMLGNANREDLNAIERAQLLKQMIDSGFDRAEAGRMFGLTSESGIKNTLRLLKLPKAIRKMVESGEINIKAARSLVPFADATMLLDDLAKQFADDEWALSDFNTQKEWKPDRSEWRPMDGETKYSPSWEYEDAVRKFDVASLHEDDRKNLGIVSLPLGDKGKMIEVAQNVELFDKLNQPHVVKRSGYGSTKSKPMKAADGESLTPAQLKAEAKRKAKEADERLAKRLPIWVRRFARCCMATQTVRDHYAIAGTLPWWLGYAGTYEIDTWLFTAAETLGVTTNARKSGRTDALANMIATMDNMQSSVFTDRLWRILVWPQKIAWRVGHVADQLSAFCQLSIGEPPQKMVGVMEGSDMDEPLAMMMQMCDVSLYGGWIDAANDGTPEGLLFEELLAMHTQPQLVRFAGQLNVKGLFDTDKKSHLIQSILNAHTFASPLRSPDFLTLGVKPTKAKKAKR